MTLGWQLTVFICEALCIERVAVTGVFVSVFTLVFSRNGRHASRIEFKIVIDARSLFLQRYGMLSVPLFPTNQLINPLAFVSDLIVADSIFSSSN